MVNDILKWLLRHALLAVVWVFLLSITIKNRTLFSYAHEVLVENAVVQFIEEEVAYIWERLAQATEIAFSDQWDEDQTYR